MNGKTFAAACAAAEIVLLAPATSAFAWHLDSACVRNEWVVHNGENEATIGSVVIPVGGSATIPEGTNSVTVRWPSDQTPRTYTRPEGCHKEVIPSTSTTSPTPTSTTTPAPTPSTTSSTATPTSQTPTTAPTSSSASSPDTTTPSSSSAPAASVVPPSATPSRPSSPSPAPSASSAPPASTSSALPVTGLGNWRLKLTLASLLVAFGSAAAWCTRRRMEQ